MDDTLLKEKDIAPDFWTLNDESRSALRSANDLQWIMTSVSRDLRVNCGIGKSDQWNGLTWSNTILHGDATEFTSGWTFGLHFRLKPPQCLGDIRDRLLLSRIHVSGSDHRISFDNGGRNIVLRCYMLADEFPTLMLWRKSHGMDQAPGPTPSRVPKSVASRV